MTPLPQLWGVLYSQPNSDGQRKMCANCRFFGSSPPAASAAGALMGQGQQGSTCQILPVPVTPESVCGYHIEQMADPELAGLESVPGGTSCDTCRFYEPESPEAGHCTAVEEGGGPAPVEALGCCAMWEPGESDGQEPVDPETQLSPKDDESDY